MVMGDKPPTPNLLKCSLPVRNEEQSISNLCKTHASSLSRIPRSIRGKHWITVERNGGNYATVTWKWSQQLTAVSLSEPAHVRRNSKLITTRYYDAKFTFIMHCLIFSASIGVFSWGLYLQCPFVWIIVQVFFHSSLTFLATSSHVKYCCIYPPSLLVLQESRSISPPTLTVC